jgi:hypothetical protein
MTMKGNSWEDLLKLEDADRLELLERCADYWTKQKDDVDALRSRIPRR